MLKAAFLFLSFMLAGSGAIGQPLRISLPASPPAGARADGTIGQGEYAVRLKDTATGIEVFASADSSALHMALKSPGSGWLAIGFGSPGMNGSVMMLAIKDGKGGWSVEQHLGRSLYRHRRVDKPSLLSQAAWQEDGRTCLEFSMPLRYAEGKSVTAGSPTPIILAYHKDKAALSKHTKKSSGMLALAPVK